MPNSNHQKEKLVADTLDSAATSPKSLIGKQATGMTLDSTYLNRNQKPKTQIVDFKLIKNNQEIVFRLCGQKAKTLRCLVERKEAGCNAMQIAKTFALRLSEYIRASRHDGLAGGHNLNIVTNKEFHFGGWHGKYILRDRVELLKDYSASEIGGEA